MEALKAAKQLVQAEEDEDEDLTPRGEAALREQIRLDAERRMSSRQRDGRAARASSRVSSAKPIPSAAQGVLGGVEEFQSRQKDAKAAPTMAGSQAAAEAKAAGGSLSERASAAARTAAAVVRQSFFNPLGFVAEAEENPHDDEWIVPPLAHRGSTHQQKHV